MQFDKKTFLGGCTAECLRDNVWPPHCHDAQNRDPGFSTLDNHNYGVMDVLDGRFIACPVARVGPPSLIYKFLHRPYIRTSRT